MGQAIEVPGLGALNTRFAEVTSVSCTPVRTCAAGGDYADASGASHGFVVSRPDKASAGVVPAGQYPGQDHDHVRDTTTSPPSARPRPRSGTIPRLSPGPADRDPPPRRRPGLPHRPGGPGRRDQAGI